MHIYHAWCRFLKDLAEAYPGPFVPVDPREGFGLLDSRYREDFRRYHTWRHIRFCLGRLGIFPVTISRFAAAIRGVRAGDSGRIRGTESRSAKPVSIEGTHFSHAGVRREARGKGPEQSPQADRGPQTQSIDPAIGVPVERAVLSLPR